VQKKRLAGDCADAMLFLAVLVAGGTASLPVRQSCRCCEGRVHGTYWETKAKPPVSHPDGFAVLRSHYRRGCVF